MFIGRERELEQLWDTFKQKRSATLVYGKRRVGKTTLIMQALGKQNKPYVYYECLKGTMRENIDGLTRQLTQLKLLTFSTTFATMQDVFAFLNSLSKELIVVIDEYPYLKAMTPAETVDSTFQSIIDNQLENINLVVSGSHIGMMRDMLKEGNALYGRFGCVMQLKELNYRAAAAFYASKSAYEKIAFYAVFGGSPYVLEQLQGDETVRENIIHTLLHESNPIYLYAAHLLLSDYSNSINAERIFTVLGNGKKRYGEMESVLDPKKTGNLSKQIKSLQALDIIQRNEPINRPNDSKKAKYEINDNLMRFYFTYVYKNQSALKMLGPETFYEEYIAPTVTEFISRRFEEICRDYFSSLAQKGKLPGIRNIGTYYYDNPSARTNGEFDVALDYGGSYTILEAKYFKNPIEMDDIHREAGQIRAITEIDVSQIGFISVNGFAQKEEGYLYYIGDDLYAD